MFRTISFSALAHAAAATLVAAALIVLGSRRLAHFDAALVAYTFATLFAFFGIVYRYSVWRQKPPTARLRRRSWKLFLTPRYLGSNAALFVKRLVGVFALNDFIWRRSKQRWLAHWLIMWGCILAVLITFPLVFGWIHFETPPNDFEHYTVYVFGFPTVTVPVHSFAAEIMFHGLIYSSIMVTAGVMIAMWRRMREGGAAALQQFGEDIFPLVLLFGISVTGLLLWVSYAYMNGYGYDFLSLFHAVTVIVGLLWLPFGKFFHIFQRPAQMGVYFYKDIGEREGRARCHRCNAEYASQMQVEDLMAVLDELGYEYQIDRANTDHYQHVCPRCRRILFGLAQGAVMVHAGRNPGVAAQSVPNG